MAKGPIKGSPRPPTHENQCRDVYGFTIRPQHLQLYKQYSAIYKEEEAERSARWESFLERYGESEVAKRPVREEDEAIEVTRGGGDDKVRVKIWGHIRPSLWPVEEVMRSRLLKVKSIHETDNPAISASEGFSNAGKEINASDNESEEMKTINETDQTSASVPTGFSSVIEESNVSEEQTNEEINAVHCEVVHNANDNDREPCPWKDELDALVQGGVPMALRGEVWQVFVGTKRRRISGHYEALLTLLGDGGGDSDGVGGLYKGESNNYSLSEAGIFEKWTNQIEKDLPRTFPGHPALDVDGRNALRRLLTAYARHNPDVGYCQAMNFFAALLLLMMPEENAFWTLTGFIDDYFEGYYSEKMLESQVDQLVLDDLVHKHFPRLVSHLDALGVQVAWVTGPWFLSIFVNILPWESVLRIWDVLLYDGNRSMLFRTALALLEQHGSAIMAAKDAGDAVSLWQSLVGSTFDSSQLVLIACMGYQFIDEIQLQELRAKNRPLVLAALSERSQWRSSKRSFSSKTFSNRGNSNGSQIKSADHDNDITNGQRLSIQEELENNSLPAVTVQRDDLDDDEICVADILEQVKWLKIELSRALVECRAANLRAEELETAFMELVKEDNRRSLTAKVESLEDDVSQLKQALAEKEEQEQAMLKVMLQMEQEQQAADDARRYAEDDAAAQRNVANALQVKYEDAIVSLEEMEKRAVLAESMLTATLQYQALDSNFPVGQPKEINGEQSRWWPRFPMKPAELPRTSEMPELADELLKMKGKTNQLPDLQKQGLLFRWREK